MILMSSAVEGLLLFFLIALIYFAPSLIAVNRGVSNQGSVFVINLFLGWTLVGWVVAAAMAARDVPHQPDNDDARQAEQQNLLAELDRRPRKT